MKNVKYSTTLRASFALQIVQKRSYLSNLQSISSLPLPDQRPVNILETAVDRRSARTARLKATSLITSYLKRFLKFFRKNSTIIVIVIEAITRRNNRSRNQSRSPNVWSVIVIDMVECNLYIFGRPACFDL